jgi:hypothetical protein
MGPRLQFPPAGELGPNEADLNLVSRVTGATGMRFRSQSKDGHRSQASSPRHKYRA